MNIDDAIWAIFSDEERTFLKTTFSKSEAADKRQAIAANFERYLQAPPPAAQKWQRMICKKFCALAG